MHSICDTVLITSDEIPQDLLRDRKIIRFRVIIRFGLTPASIQYVIQTSNLHISLNLSMRTCNAQLQCALYMQEDIGCTADGGAYNGHYSRYDEVLFF